MSESDSDNIGAGKSFEDSEAENLSDGSDEDSGEEQIQKKKRKKSSKQKKKKKKKKKSGGVSMFIADEADEDSDEEEEEEAEERYSDEDDDPEQERYMRQMMEEQDRRRAGGGQVMNWERSEAEIAKEIEEKYKDQYEQVSIHEMEDGSLGHSEVSQQSLLPSVGDPKMWVIKCKVGSEKLLALSIMNKAFHLSQQGIKFGIRSAVVGSAKGFIYVEADSEPECRTAIRTFRLFLHYTMRLVPIGDMTSILTVKSRKKPIKPGDWVRMRRGYYKGDLAQTIEVLESGTKVLIKAIPRLDLTLLKLPPDEAKERKKQMGQRKPPQKFFNYAEVREAGGDVQRKRMPGAASLYDFFQNNYFANGFLIKELNIMGVSSEDVNPTIEELQRFEERKDADDGYASDEDEMGSRLRQKGVSEMADLVKLASKEKLVLVKGDTVRVVEGDLKGLMGKVRVPDAGSNVVKVEITSEDLRGQLLDFMPSQLLKFIKVGQHAKVVDGRYTGETGTVVSLSEIEGDWVAALLTDRTNKEIQVRVAQLQQTTEVAVGLDSLRGYELYDLCQLGHAEVGVVVHVGSQDLRIISNNGVVRNYRPEEIRGKRNHVSRRAAALDARQSQIRGGDMVNVLEGQYANRSATIKHIHRAILFVHDKNYQQNSGVFVVRARSCVLAGSQASKSNIFAPVFAQNQQTPQEQPQNRPKVIGARGRVRDELISKSVKITKGPLKGYLGTVIDTTDTHVKVEVHTKAKKVMMSRNHVKVVGDEKGSLDQPRQSYPQDVPVTPFLMATTPMHGGAGAATPMYSGMMTPMHDGSQTPTHLPYTPSHSSDVWRPGAMDTPMHSSTGAGWEDDAFNPRTPGSARSDVFVPGSADRGSTPAQGGSMRLSDSRSSLSSWQPHGASSAERSDLGTPGFEPPITPNAEDRQAEGVWAAPGVVVEVIDRETQAEIVSVTQDTVKVQTESGETLNVRVTDLRPAVPEKKDHVRVISGQDTGLEGVLVGVDNQDGILKDANSEFKFVEMVSLVKLKATA